MERTRAALAPTAVPWWQRGAYEVLGHHRLLLALSSVGAAVQRVPPISKLLSRRIAVGELPLRRARLRASGHEVWLFTGCVMDAWQRPAHRAVMAVLEAMGVGVALPGDRAACCGALHLHAGLEDRARQLARRVMSEFPGEAPVLVDSAGCGAALKDYGHLLGERAAEDFSARVFDVHEWIAGRADLLPPPADAERGALGLVAVHDPCHLRHVQRVDGSVREILRRYVDTVDTDDEGRCCGAGGAYSALQPTLAGAIRDQKVEALRATGAGSVASANPGCAMWLAATGLVVRHPLEVVALAAGLDTAERPG
jgi:glycolate oxidase iron-sulfur subunit